MNVQSMPTHAQRTRYVRTLEGAFCAHANSVIRKKEIYVQVSSCYENVSTSEFFEKRMRVIV